MTSKMKENKSPFCERFVCYWCRRSGGCVSVSVDETKAVASCLTLLTLTKLTTRRDAKSETQKKKQQK